MTYLQLVNSVLRKLREEEVTTVDESDYSKLIGDFVNDAKRLVEDTWDWTGLRYTYDITSTSGTALYSLSGFNTRSKILYIHNETRNVEVLKESLQRIRQLNMEVDSATGTVVYYAVDGLDSNNDVQIRLFRTPNSTESFSVYTVKRTEDLTTDSDTTLVPDSPIIQWAYSYALRERGETGGQSAAEQALFAQQELSNAVAFDAGLSPDETVWTTV
jgi:hypothetical protein